MQYFSDGSYDYWESVEEDIYDYVLNDDELIEVLRQPEYFNNAEATNKLLFDIMWDKDEVTGNGICGYPLDDDYFKKFIIDNIDLLAEASCDMEHSVFLFMRDKKYSALDAVIRCYVFERVLDEAIEKIHDALIDNFGTP